ncbi:hypothetical protein AMTRI_Chr11g101820 [Amborella trichopoda]
MALRFPRFSQGLAQDPTTRRIWFGIATAHDFESHDDITEEGLSHNLFASHFGQLAIIFLWTSGNLPIAHAIWDPHFGQPAVEAFTRGGALGPVNIAYSDLYTGALFLLFLSAISLIAGWLHLQPKWKPSVSWFKNAESRLTKIAQDCSDSCRYSRIQGGIRQMEVLDVLPSPQGLGPLLTGQWNLYAQNPDSSAIAFVFIVAGHMYRTNFGIGHSIKDLLEAHTPPGGRLGRAHKGLYDTINNSIHFQLGLALASLGVLTSLVAQHMYSLPPYAFIAQDFTTQAAWASLFLGFHTLGLYVHNDVMLAFGTPEKQILIEPIFAQWIQSAHGKTSYGFDVLLSSTNGPAFNAGRSLWLPGWLNAINENGNSLFLTIGPGDFLVHHAIALGLHTTTLILVKGALDARGSPDKKDFGYSFPCDGPGRGGTCDISAWDAFSLAVSSYRWIRNKLYSMKKR